MGKEDNFWEHGSGPCVPAPRFTTTGVRNTAAVSPDAPWAAIATAMLRCGTTSFPSSTTTVTATTPSSSRRTSTPAWVWSVWRWSARMSTPCFDVDTVMHITNKVSEITGAHYGESNARDVSLRIITDHIRSRELYDLRRRAAEQRGPRLRPAPPAAPRGASRQVSSA